MADSTQQSREIMTAANQSLHMQRSGGTHRPGNSIGKRSAELKARHFARKLLKIALGVVGVLIAAGVVGAILNGIGFYGVLLTVLAILVVVGVLSKQKIKVPQRSDLNRGDVKQLVGRTELWLEAQRPALPAPAVTLVDQIGVQLDELGLQLEGVDQAHPHAREVRKLVGEHLPEMVDSYRRIPGHLRKETMAGSTPDDQLVESLGKISTEIDSVTRQLAQGPIDNLAIKTRYLEYRYGGDEVEGGKE